MTGEQTLITSILLATVAMFVWGGWRHDMVAVAALLVCVLTGLVPATAAFAGFAHPAVVAVACVLVLSRGLQTSGAVDALARRVLPAGTGPTLTIAALTGLGALLSGFMNNIAALALLMPVSIQVAARLELPPGKVLMPLAFGSILGGMTTLIGTPTNLIVSGFRDGSGLGGFGMFSFTPVGLAVAAAGIVFIAALGWRLVPAREPAGAEGFDVGAYMTEACVPEGSKADGASLSEIEAVLDAFDAQVLGLVRNDVRITAPRPGLIVRAGDVVVIETEATALAEALSRLGLELEEAVKKRPKREGDAAEDATRGAAAAKTDESAREADQKADGEIGGHDEKSAPLDEVALMELAVLPGSALVGRSASGMRLRTRYGVNLLAVSRQGQRSLARLRALTIQPGDLLLIQGPPDSIVELAGDTGCVPLGKRGLWIPDRQKAILSTGILLVAVAVAASGLLPPAIAFAAGVLASMVLGTVPPRAAYEAVDWPVVVLLAALLPVAGALESTGTAGAIARGLLDYVARGHAIPALGAILVLSMTLSDLMNNAATVAVMCPIALGTAAQLGSNSDTFLMAVAVGASCAFLTPIGHQNNTLILGPGGFRFGDYWRLGLSLEIVVAAVGIAMLLLVWPL